MSITNFTSGYCHWPAIFFQRHVPISSHWHPSAWRTQFGLCVGCSIICFTKIILNDSFWLSFTPVTLLLIHHWRRSSWRGPTLPLCRSRLYFFSRNPPVLLCMIDQSQRWKTKLNYYSKTTCDAWKQEIQKITLLVFFFFCCCLTAVLRGWAVPEAHDRTKKSVMMN